MPGLFDPLTVRGVTFPNRIGMSPMCQYSADGGFANDWHLVHLGARALGGAGMVMVEATAVEARGRITPYDVGIWSDDHIAPLTRIAAYLRARGVVSAIQVAHAGIKASSSIPWADGRARNDGAGWPLTPEQGGWKRAAATAEAAADPQNVNTLTEPEIRRIVGAFADAAIRADKAGFDVLEIHGAHGYLLHGFYSPLSNKRRDDYGGDFDGRTRIVRETVGAIRAVWPERKPLFIRLSASDWSDAGWGIDDSITLARSLRTLGVDLVDCSSGGAAPGIPVPYGPDFQVPFAEAIRRDAAIATAAVGAISEVRQAQAIIAGNKADLVLFGRQLLRDPFWPRKAAAELGRGPTARPEVAVQYDWWL